MRSLLATSFDRYARYSYVHDVRRTLPDDPVRILDVGDPYGTMAGLFPRDHTVSVDLFAERPPEGGRHHHVLASGFSLPFPDGSFDLVASHDVFEHIPAGTGAAFVDELLRVSSGPVVLVAPFADVRTARCESIVNAYYVARTGSTLEPLDEHADGGLPVLDELLEHLRTRGVDHVVHGDGWLYHWLAMMLVKAHFVAEGMVSQDRALDLTFNTVLRDADRAAPHYRRAIVMRGPTIAPVWVTERPAQGDVTAELATLSDLAWRLAAVLPAGVDPLDAASPFRRWAGAASGTAGPVGPLAASMAAVAERAAELWRPGGGAPVLRWPTSVLVVASGDGPAVRTTLAALAASEPVTPDEVLLSVPAAMARDAWPDGLDAAVRLVVDTEPDPVLRLNRLFERAAHPCVVVVAEGVAPAPADVAALVSELDLARGVVCVGPPLATPPTGQLASVHPDDEAFALFAQKRLVVFGRDAYRVAGGYDGQLGGLFDDVDLGWRLWVLGYSVKLAEHAAPIDEPVVPPGAAVEGSVASSMFKNLSADERPARSLAALLAFVGATGGAGLAATAPALLAGRDDVQSRRVRTDAELAARFGLPTPTAPALRSALEGSDRGSVIVDTAAGADDALVAMAMWALSTSLGAVTGPPEAADLAVTPARPRPDGVRGVVNRVARRAGIT